MYLEKAKLCSKLPLTLIDFKKQPNYVLIDPILYEKGALIRAPLGKATISD
jgi:hypothetical protein